MTAVPSGPGKTGRHRSSGCGAQPVIRPPASEDLPDLCALEKECFRGYYRAHRFSRSEFMAYLRSEQAICFIAVLHATLIGYVAGIVRVARARRSARLTSIAVSPSARRRGTGGLLMQRFLEEARRRDCTIMTLEVAVANEEAIRFFSRAGFKRLRRLPAYYSPRMDGIRMRREMS